MNKYLCYLLYSVALLIFTGYWLSTLLYCSPTNYVRIQSHTYMSWFNIYFYQKWTFFTPPPKDNQRLYFLFVNRHQPQRIIKCEILKPIQDKKRENPIFNHTHEILDNVISGCAISLNNSMVETSRYLKQKYPDSSRTFHLKESAHLICSNGNKLPGYRTLMEYAKVVAVKNNIKYQDHQLKIVMSSIPIRSFRNRFETKPPQEIVVLETPLLKL